MTPQPPSDPWSSVFRSVLPPTPAVLPSLLQSPDIPRDVSPGPVPTQNTTLVGVRGATGVIYQDTSSP